MGSGWLVLSLEPAGAGEAIRLDAVVERLRMALWRIVGVGRWRRHTRLAPLVASRVKGAAIVIVVMAADVRRSEGEGVESVCRACRNGIRGVSPLDRSKS